MARVLLILPHLPQRMGAPYLGQQYIAAALMRDGHDVRCLDMAAAFFDGDETTAVELATSYNPDMIGMTLFTLNAARGYQLAKKLKTHTRLLIAGGPHPTVCPKEPVENGFDVSVSGEGEWAVLEYARWLDKGGERPVVAGCREHSIKGPPREPIEDLDALALPYNAYPAYNAQAYSPAGLVVPGGMMTSRGCPARCTFCANYVTGRAYRWRSAENVIEEMVALRTQHGVHHFPFWDDAFTARRPRLNTLCDAIQATPALKGVTWSCITPGNMVKPHDLVKMRKAGCVAINFGIESGDYNILKVIKKGQKPQQVIDAVRAAKEAGMSTVVNFMFGFPEEGLIELQNTLDLMQKLAPYTDFFNNKGVLTPFPGTTIYDANHKKYGFTKWWMDLKMIPDEPNLFKLDLDATQRYLRHDPTLDLDFFSYAPDIKEMIAACVAFKAEHNARHVERLQASA